MRVKFSAIPSITTRALGTRQAAAATNAAEEGSPGTTTSSSSSSSTCETRAVSPSRVNGARARDRIRSVWSRLGCGSVTAVSPLASRPAISRHDLTCAVATRSS